MQESNVTVRRARDDEAEALTALSLKSKRSNGYDDAFMAACREELTVTDQRLAEGEYWVAESEELCGCACLLADPNGGSGEVHAFFIDPDWQRRGVGRLLWNKLVQRAKEQGLIDLRLDADPAAVPFYEAMGFKVVGEAPSGSIPGRSLPHMKVAVSDIAG
ncbi:GNAT family N-acetyltransferase [Pelagibius litoralis]|uniref:GNAT family N-acetyltransferase n=1 Tax=Pelagibius litoralis TaxID=374515 RepID=A0A967C5J5_9PROT|nr:GNAT family N-acetyltransferase [Pelagibius litoralis]NIA68925.1 GNAT family N-acetyltransferase [Pelagibius litoralis]